MGVFVYENDYLSMCIHVSLGYPHTQHNTHNTATGPLFHNSMSMENL